MDLITGASALAVASKLLGKTADTISEDLAKLYSSGRDKIVNVATRKSDLSRDGIVNLRVAKDVFFNGSFTDESICAEYFGGVLAAGRSEEGKDDYAIYYLDIIKSLSSRQLQLHYVIYNSLNKLLTNDPSKINLKVGLDRDIHSTSVWFPTSELEAELKLNVHTDLEALYRKGLIYEYRLNILSSATKGDLGMTLVRPTTLGVHVYTIAFNKFAEWHNYAVTNFGDFPDIQLPKHFYQTDKELLEFIES